MEDKKEINAADEQNAAEAMAEASAESVSERSAAGEEPTEAVEKKEENIGDAEAEKSGGAEKADAEKADAEKADAEKADAEKADAEKADAGKASAESRTDRRDPLIRIVKRDAMSFPRAMLVRAIGLILALIVAGVFIMLVTKLNPIKVYVSMFNGAFGSSNRSWITVRDIMLLLCVAVGLAPAFKMRFWNIGAEGQVLMGGLVTAACMMYFKALPTYLLLAVMFIASMVAGAVWGLLPAICKAKWNTNETLFTLMMNYIAIQIVEFFVDFWDKKQSHSVGQINPDGKEGWLPTVFGMQYFWNIVIVVVLTLIMFFYLRSSKQGYEISVVGESENTARYIGINVKRVIIRTMLISGAICGIAGFIAVSGTSHTISKVTADGRGFTAIIVAWLGKFNAFIMALISFLLVFLDRGAVQIATEFRLNENASEIITGIILFFVLGSEFFIDYKVVLRGLSGMGTKKLQKQKEATE